MADLTPVTFQNRKGQRLFGILHTPSGRPPGDLVLLLLSPGVKMRVGPQRLYLGITDALLALSNKQGMYAYEFVGKRYDAGDKLGYLKAIVDFALRHNSLGAPFREYLETVLAAPRP